MAATEKKQMWFWSSSDGGEPEVQPYPIAASQGIFMPGAPCYISTSGTVKLSDTADGTGDVHHGFIVGVQSRATAWPLTAELAANSVVLVQIIDTHDFYAVYTENAGTDAAAPQSIVGNRYGLTVSSTAGQVGYTSLNLANSNAVVQVYDVIQNVEPSGHAAADAPGIAIVKFIPANVYATKA
ncbi:MAG: hypothetical protein ACOYOU_18320 [Kiritimatiellia bacterium]